MKRYVRISFVALALVAAVGATAAAARRRTALPPDFGWAVVDLTHPINADIPIWPGDPEFRLTPWASFEKDGYFLNEISIGEHSGTHFGAPVHFHEGAPAAETFRAEDLVVSAVVIDITAAVGDDGDYRLSLDEVKAWEAEHGEIPAGSAVLLYTGWDRFWSDPDAYFGFDAEGGLHFPGFGAEAAAYLVEERAVAGMGIDTHGIDPGDDEEYVPNTLMLGAGGFHLENLTNLGSLPPTGAVLVIGALPIEGASGGPARVIALVPKAG
ncbi:MAG: cyclase family protein [Anaerolineae bacterium]|nr:cyclase family protein [Anaerolineae bacterium]